jgi:hypothetical protein
VTSQGSAFARFRRALDSGQPTKALAAAAELPRVSLSDALELCVILATAGDRRFDAAARRWLSLFAGKAATSVRCSEILPPMARKRCEAPLVALVFGLLVVAVSACGSTSNSTHRTHAGSAYGFTHHSARRAELRRERARARAKARARSRATARRHAARRGELATRGCPARSHVLEGVYHPDRLLVRDPCRSVTGTVILVRPTEDDGDLHFDVRLDHPDRMLMANNRSQQDGGLVVEFMPRDHGHLPAPSPGDRVSLVGAYVDDTEHAWSELHPVWAVSINGGAVARSGPQFGGSPASAYSDNALPTCRTNTGAHCTGWGGTAASSSAPPSPPPSGSRAGGGRNCTPGYSPCIPPGPDVDCAGGGGDGPRYVQGPVRVNGSDPYDLDTNRDGTGCE